MSLRCYCYCNSYCTVTVHLVSRTSWYVQLRSDSYLINKCEWMNELINTDFRMLCQDFFWLFDCSPHVWWWYRGWWWAWTRGMRDALSVTVAILLYPLLPTTSTAVVALVVPVAQSDKQNSRNMYIWWPTYDNVPQLTPHFPELGKEV